MYYGCLEAELREFQDPLQYQNQIYIHLSFNIFGLCTFLFHIQGLTLNVQPTPSDHIIAADTAQGS